LWVRFVHAYVMEFGNSKVYEGYSLDQR